MKTYLVTGAAGFIGANFIKYLLNKKYKDQDIKVIILDALTYAGNLGTIKDDIDNKRCFFVKGDIRDRELADKLFAENDIDYVVNFAAESHVDRSIEDPQLFLSVNILGTQNLLDAARKALDKSCELMYTGKYDVVVLDEAMNAVRLNLLTDTELIDALTRRPANVEVVLTGRGITPALEEYADLVTEMKLVKHPYDKGIQARVGIEY